MAWAVGLILVLVLLIIYRAKSSREIVDLSGQKWRVIGDFSNKREAAQLLDRVNIAMLDFLRVLKKKYRVDETDDNITKNWAEYSRVKNHSGDVYNIVDKLLDNYNPEVIEENDPRGTKETSYTLGKGANMFVCLRDKVDPNKLVDYDTLLFVVLHEAAHIANYNGWGHDTKYWTVFRFILHEAALAGIYKPVDYSKHPVEYCSLHIGYNPLYDETLPKLWEQS